MCGTAAGFPRPDAVSGFGPVPPGPHQAGNSEAVRFREGHAGDVRLGAVLPAVGDELDAGVDFGAVGLGEQPEGFILVCPAGAPKTA